MKTPQLDWRIVGAAAAGTALVVGVGVAAWLFRSVDPEEAERKRRSRLNQVGRIVEGHVVELMEIPAPPPKGRARKHQSLTDAPSNGHRSLICYAYSISGVSYETAQDITGLQDHAGLDRLIAGQSASIKYDPSNPSNSILLADDWSGLV